MSTFPHITALAFLAAALVGCGTGTVIPTSKFSKTPGISYALPKTEITVTHTMELLKCDSKGNFEIKNSIVISSQYLADPNHWYTIDTTGLNSWRKDNKLEVVFNENGTLKSINSKSKDRTAEAVQNVFQGLVSIASGKIPGYVSTSLATEDKGDTESATKIVCSKKAEASKEDRKVYEDKIAKAQEDIAKAKKTSDACSENHEECKTEQNKIIQAAIDRLNINHKKLTDLKAYLTVKTAFDLTKDEGEYSTATSAAYQWFNGNNSVDALKEHLIFKYFIGTSTTPGDSAVDTSESVNPKVGANSLVYRIPARSPLVICKAPCDKTVAGSQLLFRKKIDMPQRGEIAYLPLTRAANEASDIIVEFNPNGMLSKYTYDSTELDGVDPTLVFKTMAEQGTLFEQNRRSAKRDEAISQLEHEKELLKLQNEIDALKAGQ